MPQLTLDQAVQLATQQLQSGRLGEAESVCRQILSISPDNPDAQHLLGVILFQRRQLEPALQFLARAVAAAPHRASFQNNYGNALRAAGRVSEAADCYRRAIKINPHYAEGHNNLGLILGEQGDVDQSIAELRTAIQLKPSYAEAHANLGNALCMKGDLDGGIAASREALRHNPNLAEVHNNLANALREQGKLEESIDESRQALRINPNLHGPFINLGAAFFDSGNLAEAAQALRRALAMDPNSVVAHSNLGNVLRELGQIESAIDTYRRAVELAPKGAPSSAMYHSNLIFTLHFDPRCMPEELEAEHRRWSELYAEPLKQTWRPHENKRNPDRRLRIGYVSRDFRVHPVGRFMLPLISNHDHGRFEIFCYSSVQVPDSVTAALRQCADVWRDVRQLSDPELAEQVRADGIDILLDLTMHGGHNRLLAFARKPAPIQACYLAYPGFTGMSAMDYRISDPYLDPPDAAPLPCPEKTARLPRTWWCYEPPVATIPVAPPPAQQNGFITFGCLNNFGKINDDVLKTWREVLLRIPDSHLLLHCAPGDHRHRITDFFSHAAITPQRIEFLPRVSIPKYFQAYGRIDIALDPFPYTGGTTTCDALYMGVPVITLKGQSPIGRGGTSILSNLGLKDWIAGDCGQYIQIAEIKASDLIRLGELRKSLRPRMQSSPIMNAKEFAADMEALFRDMWRTYCLSA